MDTGMGNIQNGGVQLHHHVCTWVLMVHQYEEDRSELSPEQIKDYEHNGNSHMQERITELVWSSWLNELKPLTYKPISPAHSRTMTRKIQNEQAR